MVNPAALIARPLFEVGGHLLDLYVYIEAAVRCLAFDSAAAILKRLEEGPEEYAEFAEVRSCELVVDRALADKRGRLSDMPMPRIGSRYSRIVRLYREWAGRALSQWDTANIGTAITQLSNDEERYWFWRKRATLQRIAPELDSTVVVFRRSDGVPQRVRGDVALGRAFQREFFRRSAAVSRHHGDVTVQTDFGITVTDVGSRNGTRVGTRRLTPHMPVRLAHGDELTLGTTTLLVELPWRSRLRG
jgi:hypothetical protein